MEVQYTQRCGLLKRVNGAECGLTGKMMYNTLRWFGHVERMQDVKFTKVDEREVEGPGVTGKPPIKWDNGAEEQMRERTV